MSGTYFTYLLFFLIVCCIVFSFWFYFYKYVSNLFFLSCTEIDAISFFQKTTQLPNKQLCGKGDHHMKLMLQMMKLQWQNRRKTVCWGPSQIFLVFITMFMARTTSVLGIVPTNQLYDTLKCSIFIKVIITEKRFFSSF